MATKEERQLLVTNKHGPTYKLHLNKETKRTTIAKALLANQTVKHMSIFVESNFMTGVSPESLRKLFRAIGSLPLENLHIYSYGDNMDIFPVQLIGDILKVAFKLIGFDARDRWSIRINVMINEHDTRVTRY